MTQREQVAVSSRAFSLAAVFGLSLLSAESAAIEAVLAVAVVAGLATYVSIAAPTVQLIAVTAETVLVGLIMGLTYPQSLVLLPYLVVLPLLAGLIRGLLGVSVTMAAAVVALIGLPLLATGLTGQGRVSSLAPWMLTALGAGLIGAWARKLGHAPQGSLEDSQYEAARQLLTQLRTIARRLSAGLDVEGMASQLLSDVHEHLGDSCSGVFANMSGSVLVPLAYRGKGARETLMPTDHVIARCWAEMEPAFEPVPSGTADIRYRVALPLRVGNRMVGIVSAACRSATDSRVVDGLMPILDGHSLRMDTALVFDEIRTLATADERQRLAREIHDGIAQEVASLGYVVDDLAAEVAEPSVRQGLRGLRSELSRVVADLRLSIFDLRSDVTPTAGLGAVLSEYVRQVGAKSGLKVHLTLHESPVRLSPVVEGELLRIAQEAITNARKHASAENLWVEYWTSPPEAMLTIRDDGLGLGEARDDSYGLTIMRERAARIDACLEISGGIGAPNLRGTNVRVTVTGTGNGK